MPVLTFEETTGKEENNPIAIIRDGKHDLKIVYVDEVTKLSKMPKELSNVNVNALFKNYTSREKARKLTLLQTAISRGVPPVDEELEEIYNQVQKDSSKEIVVHDGHCTVMPNPYKRQCIYIFGASGAGKSTWISMYFK
jgi:ABC-type iron transport system FetAB ATPase subunit